MSEVVGEAVVRIKADPSGASTVEREGKEAGESYKRGFGGSVKGLVGIVGGVLAIGKTVDLLKDSVAQARDSNAIAATTAQVIKSTGDASNLTAKQVGNLATALSMKTGVDDETIQSGQNLLLTFNKISDSAGKGNDIFTRATKSAIDLSRAGFGSVNSASVQLGKALQDPIKGITALARSGVTFDAQQQATIKHLVATGDILSAQKIILKGVEGQVGGVGEATATNAERASVAWGNVKEAIGNVLIPVLDRLEGYFVNKIVPGLFAIIAATSKIKPAMKEVENAILSALSGPGGKAASSFFDQVKEFAAGVLPLLVGVLHQVAPIFVQLLDQLKAAALQVLPVMHRTLVTQVLPALQSLGTYVVNNILPIFVSLAHLFVTQVIPILISLATFIYGTVYPAIVQIVVAVATRLKPVFDQLVATFKADVLPTLTNLITTIRTQLLPVLEPIVEKVLTVVGAVLKLAAAILAKVLPPLIRFVGFILEKAIPVLAQIIIILAKVVSGVLSFAIAFGKALVGPAQAIGSFVSTVTHGVGAVLSAFAQLPLDLARLDIKFAKAGLGLMKAIFHGLGQATGFAGQFAAQVWDAIKGFINSGIDKLNGLLDFKISIPHAPDIHVNAPDIPHLAVGSQSTRAGRTVVGEAGPEIVDLPAGATVRTAAMTRALGGGTGGGVYVHQLVAHDYADFMRQAGERYTAASIGGRPPVGVPA